MSELWGMFWFASPVLLGDPLYRGFKGVADSKETAMEWMEQTWGKYNIDPYDWEREDFNDEEAYRVVMLVKPLSTKSQIHMIVKQISITTAEDLKL